jgi:hypothetical protein
MTVTITTITATYMAARCASDVPHPGLSGPAGMSNVDPDTLAGDTVHTWHCQVQMQAYQK